MTASGDARHEAVAKQHLRQKRAIKRGDAVIASPKHRSSDEDSADDDSLVARATYTIKEFCHAHRLSEAMYYKLRAAGLGPREMRALKKVTISIEAAAEWRRQREAATA
jgi:hypothetical protein